MYPRIDPALLQFLETHAILFEYYEHIPLFTVEEAEQIKHQIPGKHTKNLFLSDKKGSYYLVSIEAHKRFPVNAFRKYIGCRELSFGSVQELHDELHLIPGSVSLFGLIHASSERLKVYIDQDLWTASHVGRHPNRNDATLTIQHEQLENFLRAAHHTANIISFDENTLQQHTTL